MARSGVTPTACPCSTQAILRYPYPLDRARVRPAVNTGPLFPSFACISDPYVGWSMPSWRAWISGDKISGGLGLHPHEERRHGLMVVMMRRRRPAMNHLPPAAAHFRAYVRLRRVDPTRDRDRSDTLTWRPPSSAAARWCGVGVAPAVPSGPAPTTTRIAPARRPTSRRSCVAACATATASSPGNEPEARHEGRC